MTICVQNAYLFDTTAICDPTNSKVKSYPQIRAYKTRRLDRWACCMCRFVDCSMWIGYRDLRMGTSPEREGSPVTGLC